MVGAALADSPATRTGMLISTIRRDVFIAFQQLIHRESGIWLSEMKKALLVGRLNRRLRELDLPDLSAYLAVVERDPAERVKMLDAIATNETQFFREPRQLELLAAEVVPRWVREADAGLRPRRVRVWSAGCSTGEEPYTVAMLLLYQLPPGWSVEILATDISTKALAKARAGIYPLEKSVQIPDAMLKRFMLRGTGAEEGRMRAGDEITSLIRFDRLNLADERWPALGRFDLILCRNVLIYFDPPGKARVIGRLVGLLGPRGVLLVGHAESLTGLSDAMRTLAPTIYELREANR